MAKQGKLTLTRLKIAANGFVREISSAPIDALYGATDGKAVGTYVEHAFHEYLKQRHSYVPGSSASGIDFPDIQVDLKVTSIRQPQSSCPFQEASQKVYGLGYHLLIFIYDKTDDHASRTAHLQFQHAIYMNRKSTGDYQTTYGLREILRRNGNKDDIIAFLEERNLPLEEIGREALAERIMSKIPPQGCLTISNALQWRLQYRRAISLARAGTTPGLEDLFGQ